MTIVKSMMNVIHFDGSDKDNDDINHDETDSENSLPSEGGKGNDQVNSYCGKDLDLRLWML